MEHKNSTIQTMMKQSSIIIKHIRQRAKVFLTFDDPSSPVRVADFGQAGRPQRASDAERPEDGSELRSGKSSPEP